MSKKTRILERVNSDGLSCFVVQRKWLGCFWLVWESEMGPIEFDTLEECRKWLNYDPIVEEIIHEARARA